MYLLDIQIQILSESLAFKKKVSVGNTGLLIPRKSWLKAQYSEN